MVSIINDKPFNWVLFIPILGARISSSKSESSGLILPFINVLLSKETTPLKSAEAIFPLKLKLKSTCWLAEIGNGL